MSKSLKNLWGTSRWIEDADVYPSLKEQVTEDLNFKVWYNTYEIDNAVYYNFLDPIIGEVEYEIFNSN